MPYLTTATSLLPKQPAQKTYFLFLFANYRLNHQYSYFLKFLHRLLYVIIIMGNYIKMPKMYALFNLEVIVHLHKLAGSKSE